MYHVENAGPSRLRTTNPLGSTASFAPVIANHRCRIRRHARPDADVIVLIAGATTDKGQENRSGSSKHFRCRMSSWPASMRLRRGFAGWSLGWTSGPDSALRFTEWDSCSINRTCASGSLRPSDSSLPNHVHCLSFLARPPGCCRSPFVGLGRTVGLLRAITAMIAASLFLSVPPACCPGHEAHHIGGLPDRPGAGPDHPRLGEDDLNHGELRFRDDRLFPNLRGARPDAGGDSAASGGHPLWRVPGCWGNCSDRISRHFTLEHASPHTAR